MMGDDMAIPWKQQPTEPGSAYARFLLYRNLGPGRSHRKAYLLYLQRFDGYRGGLKGLNVPHSWRTESKKFGWVDRAIAWDVNVLQMQGAKIAALHTATVCRLAAKCAERAKRVKPGDDDYGDFLNTVRAVGAFLSPELLRGVQDRYRPVGRTAAAEAKGDGVE